MKTEQQSSSSRPADAEPIRVLTVTTDVVLQMTLRAILATITNLELVGEVDTLTELVDTTNRTCPNIVLFDTAADIGFGKGIVARLMEQCPKVNVLLIGSQVDLESTDGIRSIRTLAELRPATTRSGGPHPDGTEPSLSTRETEVLRLLAVGLSSKEIADHLIISVRTVESHRTQIMRKLNRRTIAGLTKYAIRQGLTPL